MLGYFGCCLRGDEISLLSDIFGILASFRRQNVLGAFASYTPTSYSPRLHSTHRQGDVAQLSNIQASSRAGEELRSELEQ